MSWIGLTLVTDQDLGALEPEATATEAPWGRRSWPEARFEAKRDLKIWLESDFADVPGVADRVLDRWRPDLAFALTASVYTDVTSALADDTEEDRDLSTVFVTASADRLYVGALWTFSGLFVKLLDSVNATASVLTAKYWGANQWMALTTQDDTAVSGKTFAQSGRLTWVMPTDWERRRLNGSADEYYWVELSVSATPTTGTAVTQLLPLRAPDGLRRVAGWLALGHVLNGLALQATQPDRWRERAENYEERARELYARLRDKGGIPIDVNRTEAIQPAEAHVRSPHVLWRA